MNHRAVNMRGEAGDIDLSRVEDGHGYYLAVAFACMHVWASTVVTGRRWSRVVEPEIHRRSRAGVETAIIPLRDEGIV